MGGMGGGRGDETRGEGTGRREGRLEEEGKREGESWHTCGRGFSRLRLEDAPEGFPLLSTRLFLQLLDPDELARSVRVALVGALYLLPLVCCFGLGALQTLKSNSKP